MTRLFLVSVVLATSSHVCADDGLTLIDVKK